LWQLAGAASKTNLPTSLSEPEIDVIFVHGLGSDAGGWINSDTKFNWPQELGEKDGRLRTFAIEYYAPMTGRPAVVRATKRWPSNYSTISRSNTSELGLSSSSRIASVASW
jgi:hypothetical protein